MKRMTAIILAALLLAGCGSIEEEATQKAPAAPVTEQTDDVEGETVTHIMTTIFGTTTAVSTPEKPKETTTTTATHTNLEDDTVMFTTSQGNAAGLSDTADTFTQAFLDTIVSAEYIEFGGEKRYLIEGDALETVKTELSAFHGRKCEDPVIDGSYLFVLRDSGGNEHYVDLMGEYIVFDSTYYHDREYDPDGSRSFALAEYFRSYGRRVDENGEDIPQDKLNEVTAQFELVQLRPGGQSGYVIHDTCGHNAQNNMVGKDSGVIPLDTGRRDERYPR